MNLHYRIPDIIRGGLTYMAGDTVAALITDEFSLWRTLGMFVIGATVYAFEIPNYFAWIDKKATGKGRLHATTLRTALAILYFNPLWIARHLLFLKLLMCRFDEIGWGLLATGGISFAVNIPLIVVANFLIQNVIALRWRFVASAVFSGLMAVYYALSAVWFAT